MSRKRKKENGISYSVSQNFLTSKKTICRILNISNICNNDYVIEIGAGKGHITKELIKRSGKVAAYEIDSKLYQYLNRSIMDRDKVCLMNQNFLKVNLPKGIPYKVFSNIPFNITTEIVRKLTESNHPPDETWLIMEKGAAKRFIGKPKETVSSLLLKPYFDTKIKYHFSRDDFHPMPSVDIVLFYMKKKTKPDIPVEKRREFDFFVRHCMKYGIGTLLTKKQISMALRKAGAPVIKESGLMLYVQWLCLFRCYDYWTFSFKSV